MLTEPEAKPKSPARKIWQYGSIVLAIGLLYSAWTVYSRWQSDRALEEKNSEQKKAAEREDAAKTVENLGGSQFDILNFYASPGNIHRGESAQLCYGVSNAKTVKLDPPAADVWPSYSRCFDVTPNKETTYTLTADDGKGNTKAASVTIKVN
jgi:hypothetical protein